MGRAAASAGVEAEGKVREAAVAGNRAREAIEEVLLLSQTEREKKRRETKHIAAVSPKLELVDHKKKMTMLSNAVAAMVGQKGVQNSVRKGWIGIEQMPVQDIVEGKNKIDPLIGIMSHSNNAAMEGRLARLSHAPNLLGQLERGERGVLKVLADRGHRIPESSKDASLARIAVQLPVLADECLNYSFMR